MIAVLLWSQLVFADAVVQEMTREINKSAKQVCETYYSKFLKEQAKGKKFNADEKSVMINSCTAGCNKGAAVCVGTFSKKFQALEKKKMKLEQLKAKANAEQPAMKECFANSFKTAIFQMNQLGKQLLAKKK